MRKNSLFALLFLLTVPIQASAYETPKDGKEKIYYPNGQLQIEQNYKSGKLDGGFRQFYEDGKLMKEISFKAGQLHGPGKSYYPDGKVLSDGVFENGTGTIRMYRPDESLEFETAYDKAVLSKTGFYYRNGKLAQACEYRNGGFDNDCLVYYEDGTLFAEGHERNLQIDGIQKFYRPDGTLDYAVNYTGGRWDENNQTVFPEPDGVRKLYYKSGKLAQEAFFKDGKRVDISTTYYENGNPFWELLYKQGRVEGPFRLFTEDKQLLNQGSYLAGNLNGDLTLSWHGRSVETRTYKDGILIRRLDPSGKELPLRP